MTVDFSNVYQVLSNGQPPEITHFQKGSHPGRGWYLKTAVPIVGEPDLYKIWRRLSKQHSNLICLTPESYNWNQQLIQNVFSVWVRETIDVRLNLREGVYDYSIIPFEDSFNIHGKTLKKQLVQFQKQNPHAKELDDLHYLSSVIQFMCDWHTDAQARARRSQFRVVTNEEDHSNSHQSTQLDTNRVGQ